MSAGRDWLALGIAVYGALVASSVAAYQFLRDRPGIKIFIASATTVIDDADEPHIELWSIRLVNHRKRPITIEEGGLLLKDGLQIPSPAVDHLGQNVECPFPMVLVDGESRRFYVPRQEGFLGIEIEGAWAKDALNHVYEVRYPSRNPVARIGAWRERRALARVLR